MPCTALGHGIGKDSYPSLPRSWRNMETVNDETRAAVERFHDALNAHDIDALAACITDDCLFEDTTPPDGTRHAGRDAMLDALRRFFADSPAAHFDIEELITAGD